MKSLSILVIVGILSSTLADDMSLQVSVIEPDMDLLEVPEENVVDLCEDHKCAPGEQCIIIDSKPACQCIQTCDPPKDDRQKICSTSNKTYVSDCHFYREKCWCKNSDTKCNDASVLEEKLDYYGECRYIGECTEQEKEVFPSRMKQWLNEVLIILNQRKDLDPKYINLVELAEKLKNKNVEKYWTAGVAFEFCQLDKSKDHLIQKEELSTLISSIKALENCIQPFLNECDSNNDDVISDEEWGSCLDLSSEDLDLLRKYC